MFFIILWNLTTKSFNPNQALVFHLSNDCGLVYWAESIYFDFVLTLIRLTSERPCQDREGAPGAPPIYLGSGANFCSKIMFPQKLASIPTHLAPFQNIFSKNHKKIGENWKSIKKLLKMSENSKICSFWAILTCNTSKERIFHIKFNFT